MIVGCAREIKDHESRVGLVPWGVKALREAGHQVLIEAGAGVGSSIPDHEYVEAGAEIVARAIDRIYQLKVPTNPSSNLNIGMLGGSEVVNAKAADAWFTVDLRSTSNDVIADLEKQIKTILDEEAKRAGMTVKTDVISTSPAAVLPGNRDSRLVKIAEAVHRRRGRGAPSAATTSPDGR